MCFDCVYGCVECKDISVGFKKKKISHKYTVCIALIKVADLLNEKIGMKCIPFVYILQKDVLKNNILLVFIYLI